MSFWKNLLTPNQQENEHKNQIACIENDYSCKSNDQLLSALMKEADEEIISGIKNVLISRGYSRKELITLIPAQTPI